MPEKIHTKFSPMLAAIDLTEIHDVGPLKPRNCRLIRGRFSTTIPRGRLPRLEKALLRTFVTGNLRAKLKDGDESRTTFDYRVKPDTPPSTI